jgi:hypothetical protein
MNSTFILIKSCWRNKDRRQASRETWLTRLDHDWADYAFIVGAHKPTRLYGNPLSSLYNEIDVEAYLLPDDFRQIGPKLQAALVDVCAKNQYERIVVLDDDTYVIPEHLRAVVETVEPADYVGFLRNGAGSWGSMKYMQGSAYVLGSAAALICSVAATLKEVKPDDVAVGEALEPYFIQFCHDPRFHPGPLWHPFPFQDGLITTHKVKSSVMSVVHAGVLDALQYLDKSK